MGKRKEFLGTVISDKMQKTIIVKITLISRHAKYGRIMKKYHKFKVHDEKGEAKIGDFVKIQETRPISKDKRFRLLEIVKKTQSPQVQIKEENA